MTATITYPGGTIVAPLLIVADTFKTKRAANNQIHQLLSGGIAATMRPASPRTGEIVLLYGTKTAAESARDTFGSATVFTYSDDSPAESLSFIVTDTVSCELMTETMGRWLVTVPYQAVS